jgi:hypothetical protein
VYWADGWGRRWKRTDGSFCREREKVVGHEWRQKAHSRQCRKNTEVGGAEQDAEGSLLINGQGRRQREMARY